jgi:hypothetical protein
MSHERTLIRNATITQLTGRTDCGNRVYKTRMGPVREHLLPCICVYVTSDDVDPRSKANGPRELIRTASLVVEGWVAAAPSADIDTALDDLGLQIETAMDLDVTLDKNASDSILSSTSFVFDPAGARPMACIHLEYDVDYFTGLRLAEPVDKFDVAGVTYKLSPTQPDADQLKSLVDDIYG